MARRPSSFRVGPRDEVTDLMGMLHDMIESYQQQTTLLRDGQIAVQQTATVAMERAVANVSDFRRLQPTTFAGTEKSLDAEQWLVDMTNLLNVDRVPKDNQVEVIKIQLIDVAQTWWIAEEERLEKPVPREKFTESFYK